MRSPDVRVGGGLGPDAPNLDLLRSSAVVLVLLFHTVAFFDRELAARLRLDALGHLGVLLFFVHTSLVLMLSLERQTARYGYARFFWIFMTRRAFRIYPLSVLVVLMVVLLELPVAGHPWNMQALTVKATGLVANVLLVQNVTLSGSVIGPLWSLPYEIQMYLVLPAIFLLVRRLPSWRWALLLWALSVGVALVRVPVWRDESFFRYVPNFLGGVIAYRLAVTTRPRFPAFAWPGALLGLVLLYAVGNGRDEGWLVCLLAGLAIPQFSQIDNGILRSASRVVAKHSYGIYLSHYAILWFSFTALALLPAPARWAVFLTALVGIPLALYQLVEAPCIHAGNTIAHAWSAGRRAAPVERAAAPAPAAERADENALPV